MTVLLGNDIVIQRRGSFSSIAGKYIYILDSTGEPVTTTGVAIL